jgi:hypothetical protein
MSSVLISISFQSCKALFETLCILQCKTCDKSYIGQSERPITIKRREHVRYIRTNNSTSAYVNHILNNRKEYGNPEQTLQLLQSCNKGNLINCWETFHMQQLQHLSLLIGEQQPHEMNPLYALDNITGQTDTRQAAT